MLWLDRKYTLLLSPKLQLFKQKNTNLFNFRCPVCLDSQKNKSKARGYIFSKGENYFFGCHNCGSGMTLKNFIEFVDPYLSKEYSLENFKEKNTILRKPELKPSVPKFIKKIIDLPTINSLHDDNIAKQYVKSRFIPESTFKNLFYAENFKVFVESVSDKKLSERLDYTKPRLIIPFINRFGELIAFQGRALDDISIRYITVKIKDEQKIFGANTIDITKKIKVTEGPLDSLFLDNCVATADSDLASVANIFDKANLILIPDLQPRNKDLLKIIETKFIDKGFSVCLLPETLPGKDINDFIMNGLTKEDLNDIILSHTYSGLRAKMEFINWKKI